MSPRVPHRPKYSKSSRSSIFVGISALLAGVVIAGVAVGVAQGRDSKLRLARAADTDDTSRPSRPTRLRLADATPTSVTLNWRRSYDNVGVVGYEVYLAGGPTFLTPQTTYTISSLACRTTYRVGVAAYDAAGQRSRATWISVSTRSCPPPPPPAPPPPPPPPRHRLRRHRRRHSSVGQSHPVTGRRCVDLGSGRLDGERHEREPSFDPLPGRWRGQVDGVLRAPSVQRRSRRQARHHGLSNGTHVLVAQARNSNGAEIGRVTSRVTVSNMQPSPASLTQSPGDGASISGQVAWTVNVTSGSPASIHFLVDGVDKWTEYYALHQYNGDPDGKLDTTEP